MNQIIIGKFIAELRHEKGMTQETLGNKIGVTNKTISRWENGNYMPDIEMLQIISNYFHVSINELLCGQRLDESSFQQGADENVVTLLKESAFSREEKISFWRKKWCKEHIALLIVSLAVMLTIFIVLYKVYGGWLIGLYPLVILFSYVILRNRLMIYVESHVYTIPPENLQYQ